MNKKGFTLIELLITIGILAILATLVVLVLNPAELFRQARDSQRLGDLATLQRAISYYMSTATNPTIAAAGPFATTGTACGFGTSACTATTRNIYAVDNTGWVPISLNLSQGGAPIARLPQDPSQDATTPNSYFYSFKGDTTTLVYEINARLESSKYKVQMGTDGGDANACTTYVEQGSSAATSCYFEVGTSLTQ